MFKHTVTRTLLGAALMATLLAPAAHADDRDSGLQLQGLDRAIATAIRDHASFEQRQVTLDPAIRTALADREPASHPVVMTALADRAARDLESSSQSTAVSTDGEAFDWNAFGLGTGTAFVVLLLGFGFSIAARHGRLSGSSA